ncbi:hypothetical protein [Streptomyces sp. P9-A2]
MSNASTKAAPPRRHAAGDFLSDSIAGLLTAPVSHRPDTPPGEDGEEFLP